MKNRLNQILLIAAIISCIPSTGHAGIFSGTDENYAPSGIVQEMTYTMENCPKISVVKGDITQQKVDVIVNAANSQLSHGGGVAAAISKACGPELQQKCHETVTKDGPVDVGSVRLTPSYNLGKNPDGPKYIVHTVGPHGTDTNREELLIRAYQNSLHEVVTNCKDVKSIAFPCISTAIFGYSIEEATPIAMQAVLSYLKEHENTNLKEVKFVIYNSPNADQKMALYQKECYKYWNAPTEKATKKMLLTKSYVGPAQTQDNSHSQKKEDGKDSQNSPDENSIIEKLKSPYFMIFAAVATTAVVVGIYKWVHYKRKKKKEEKARLERIHTEQQFTTEPLIDTVA
jgi:O-acetyl-ADP-ribose deacetylase (regulator of RNase III)